MLRRFRTEIKPTEYQKNKIYKTIGVARFVYNFYISENQKAYKRGEKFISAFSFSK